MRLIDLDQKSQEWLDWRRKGIGSSEIAAIIGTDPYNTPYKVWLNKLGYAPDFKGNKFTEHGNNFEPVAREWLNNKMNLNLKPLCGESETNPIFKFSADGYDLKKEYLFEIKCPLNYDHIMEYRIAEDVPIKWKAQILWQAKLLNAKKSFLAVWDFILNECIVIPCKRDEKLENLMEEKAVDFWEKVKKGEPPELEEKDILEIEDPKLEKLLNEYGEVTHKIKKLQDQQKSLRDPILEFGDDGNFQAYGYKMIRLSPRESIDLKRMQADGIDVSKYKKKSEGLGSYMIRCPRST